MVRALLLLYCSFALQAALPCRKIPTACELPLHAPTNFQDYCTGLQSPWYSRQAVAASWIWESNPKFVLDLGAGCLDLQQLLPSNTSYIPDEVNRGGCDYNTAIPKISDEQKRLQGIVVVLGVIEYLCDPLSFLVALKTYNQRVIISYAVMPDRFMALTPPRVNAFTSQQWDDMLAKAGWKSAVRHARVFTNTATNSMVYFSSPFTLEANKTKN